MEAASPQTKTDVMNCFRKGKTMEWTAPKFEEVALNCEINSYASAAL
jgi:coenzyme PQQ precursor peptide PqqA